MSNSAIGCRHHGNTLPISAAGRRQVRPLPVTNAAMNLEIAIATLPAIAAMMTRREPECSCHQPVSAAARAAYRLQPGLVGVGLASSAVALVFVAHALVD